MNYETTINGTINEEFKNMFIEDYPKLNVDFESNDVKIILNNIQDYEIFASKLKSYLYSLKRKEIKNTKIYREKTFSLEDLQFNVEKTLLEFSNDYRIILLDCFVSNYNNFIEYSSMIQEYGIQIFKNIPNKLSVKFSIAIPQYIKINYLKIKTGSSEIFGIRDNEPILKNRVRKSASSKNFNQDIQDIKKSSDNITQNLVHITPRIKAKLID